MNKLLECGSGLFFIATVGLLVAINGLYYQQYFDAEVYSSLADHFNNWSAFNSPFPDTYRGYFFPLVINLLGRPFGLNPGVIVLNSLSVTVLAYVIAPRFYQIVFKSDFYRLNSLMLGLLLLYFWHGYFQYALSDFPALVCLCLAMALVLRRNVTGFLCAGVFLAAAINIRPLYQANLLPFGLFIVCLYARDQINLKALAGLVFGMMLVLTPQLLINHHYDQSTYSPLVRTERFSGNNLYMSQLFWGLKAQKYETFVGDNKNYPFAEVIFKDDDGIKLAHTYVTSPADANIRTYFSIATDNPGYFATMALKHLFNGLDIKYNSVYVADLNTSAAFSLFNYVVLASGLASIGILIINRFEKCKAQALNKTGLETYFLLANLVLPVLLVIPTALEVRFFLPLHCGLYLCGIHFINKFRFANGKQNLLVLVAVILLASGGFWLSDHTYKSLSYRSGAELLR